MNPYQRMLFYAMGGVFAEVIFTSFKTLYYHQDFMLHGNTQLWVIIIYALGGLLFEQVHHQINSTTVRVSMYLLLVYILEYTAGWILLQLLGECPWHYYEPGNIHGLVQLRYIPSWLLFVIIANKGIYYALNYDLVRVRSRS